MVNFACIVDSWIVLFVACGEQTLKHEQISKKTKEMPLIRPGMRKPPPDFDVIRSQLEVYEAQMKDILFNTKPTTSTPSTATEKDQEGTPHNSGAGSSPSKDDGCATSKQNPTAVSGRAMRQSLTAQKRQGIWEMNQVQYNRTRYVYDTFREGKISEKCFSYCCDMSLIDKALPKLWAVQGYETVCCAGCVTPSTFSGGASSCRCRVPSRAGRGERCLTCGCEGCASGATKKRAREEDREAENRVSQSPNASDPHAQEKTVVS